MGTAFIDAHEKAPEMFNHFRGFVLFNNGGEIGIRTLGTVASTTDFESVPFGHSGISPTARIIARFLILAKPFFKKTALYQLLARLYCLKRDAEAVCNFFVGFDNVAQTLTEAVLVHFLAGSLVPQTAAVRAEFVTQDD